MEEKTKSGLRFWLVVSAVVAACAIAINAWLEHRHAEFEVQSELNLEKGVIRAKLDGRHFDIPVRYMYSEGYGKKGDLKYWPTPKEGRPAVGYLGIAVLLLDMRPYAVEDDARWKATGWGDQLKATLSEDKLKTRGWVKYMLTHYQKLGLKRESDMDGLIHFIEPERSHYLSGEGQPEFSMTCGHNGSAPSPSCSVKSTFSGGPILEYGYSIKYKSSWKEIDKDLRALFQSFERPAIAQL